MKCALKKIQGVLKEQNVTSVWLSCRGDNGWPCRGGGGGGGGSCGRGIRTLRLDLDSTGTELDLSKKRMGRRTCVGDEDEVCL